jgi:hypothetical protein
MFGLILLNNTSFCWGRRVALCEIRSNCGIQTSIVNINISCDAMFIAGRIRTI